MTSPGKKVRGTVIFTTKKGKNVYLELHLQNLLHEPVIESIVVYFRDITKRIKTRKNLIYIANHDELTGLPNSNFLKRLLRNKCQMAKKKQEEFILMMLDIDDLKYLNCSLGYDIGDQLIVEFVKRLKVHLDNNIFLCRYSEDHFAFIAEGLNNFKEYENLAEKILCLFSQPFKINNYVINVSANMGISVYPRDGEDEETLRKNAKVAILGAKKEGKNKFKIYSSDLNIQNYKDFILRSDLFHALEKEQLKIYYQPIINLKTSEIIAAEALLRWEHPEWGIVSAEEFISLAEETGLIVDIFSWLLREICGTYQKWLNEGLPSIKIAVNFSSVQFFESNFVNSIKNTIEEFRLEPNFLIMEITENVLMKNLNKINTDFEELRSLGIKLAIDDFGNGYSSLPYLCSLKIDHIKLADSFIKNAIKDKTSIVITGSILKMARDLNLKLVAKGIENWEQLSYLKDLNCRFGQGFLYSKPLGPEEFQKLLAKRKCKPTLSGGAEKSVRGKRRYFRVDFYQLLEAEMTILSIRGKNVNVGNTKVLIENMGPGGLRFISNIRFPVEKFFILQFTTELLGEKIKVYGYPVWGEKLENNLYQYGLEFTIDENERMELTRLLNQVQIKMRKNVLFAEGNFVPQNPGVYFKMNDVSY